MSPPTSDVDTPAERQLDLVRSTPPWLARHELDLTLRDRVKPLSPEMVSYLEQPDIVARLADAMAAVCSATLTSPPQPVNSAGFITSASAPSGISRRVVPCGNRVGHSSK